MACAERRSDGLWERLAGCGPLPAGLVLAGAVVSLSEWLAGGGRGGVTGLFVGLAMVAPAALLFGLTAGLATRGWFFLVGRVRSAGASCDPGLGSDAPWLSVRGQWLLFFALFFLAFVPYPLAFVMVNSVKSITDLSLLVRFTASATVPLVGAALVVSLALAWGSSRLLRPLGLEELAPGPLLFYCASFPLPWLAVPMAVYLSDAGRLAKAGPAIFGALLLVLGPLLGAALARLPRVGRWLAGLSSGVGAVVLGALAAQGALFSPAALERQPLAAAVYGVAARLADLDGDGSTAWFDGRDCAEGDSSIHPLATDIPGNGVDEDCSGADAEEQETGLLGDARPFGYHGARRFNFLFIMVDALRPDHLHFMGYERETSPNLDRLAAESLVFSEAICQYPSTGISVPSMLAGVYPEYMAWGEPGRSSQYVLEPDNTLITDVLGRHGYQTGALVAAWIKRNITGLERHFQELAALYPHDEWRKWVRDSGRLSVRRAIQFLEHRDRKRPFFLFVHMEDPHEPYVNHAPPGRKFGKKARDRYDSDVHWTDLWLGFLLGYIEQEDWYDDTVIIVVADHGEEFKEHGKEYHGHQIYQESIRVPLIIRIPGQEPQFVDHRVALVDLFPTILDLTGIDHPRSRLQGVSLLRTAAREERDDRFIFSMLADREKTPTARSKAVFKGRYKLIADLTNDMEEFYDLFDDPGEKQDLAPSRPPEMKPLRRALESFLGGSDPSWKLY